MLIQGLRIFALEHTIIGFSGTLLFSASKANSLVLDTLGLSNKQSFACSIIGAYGSSECIEMRCGGRVTGGNGGSLSSCTVNTADAMQLSNPSLASTWARQPPLGRHDSNGCRIVERPRLAINNTQQGVSLIEVLITLLVLSVGLIGLAGLQMVSIQANKSAYYRSQATLLAYDMADRMRANQVQANTDVYFLNYPASSTAHEVSGNQANKDLSEWLNALAQTLPDGTAAISRDERLLSISIRWNNNRGRVKARSDTQPYTETFVYRTEI